MVIRSVNWERRWASESVAEEGFRGHEMVGVIRAREKVLILGLRSFGILKGLLRKRDEGFERGECR